ncbi:MAG: type VII secretion protein EssC [Clostridia bacterium]|nr:type VII secretion protein EssC [Clostridia bacterium]
MVWMMRLRTEKWEAYFRTFPFRHEITIGGTGVDISVPGCTQGVLLRCAYEKDAFTIAAQNGGKLAGSESGIIRLQGETEGEWTLLDIGNGKPLSIQASMLPDEALPHYDRSIDISEDQSILVGAGRNADIPLRHSLIPDEAFRLRRKQKALLLEQIRPVPMGVYVNTRKTNGSATVRDGDFLFCVGFRAYWHDGQLHIPSNDGIEIHTLHYVDEKEQNSHLEYPRINRTSRFQYQRSTEPIEIQDPPNNNNQNKNNLLMSLLPVSAMILLTLFLRGTSSSNLGMVLFSVASLAIGGVTSVLTYIQTSKENKKKSQQRVETYNKYIQQQRKMIRDARDEEREIQSAIYIDPETELQNVWDFSGDLFDRHLTDADFLDVRLGTGDLRSSRKIVCKKHEVFEASDELFSLPNRLQKEFEFIHDMPAAVPLREANAIGIVGDEDKLEETVKNMMLDLSTRQYFDDVKLYLFLSDVFRREVECFRSLPHLKNKRLDRRNIAHDEESQTVITEDLYKELSDREAIGTLPEQYPWLVVFVYADESALMQHPVIRYVEKASSLHAAFIFLTQHRELLPQGCSYRVLLATNEFSGVIVSMKTDVPDQLFSYKCLAHEQLRKMSERLAPVYSGEVNLATSLSSHESLFHMMGVHDAQELNILQQWRSANSAESLAAPLGVMDTGNVLMLDLHERAHGPHGLVAGTTGSGKSQVLISYLLSLSSRFSPEDVAFCIIDFKGGDIIKHLPGLPHIAGSITNLEKHEITRSLKSINAEKNKRMALFAEPQVNASNISEYTKAYKEGRAKVPLPHLIIIVDEFAELKSQHPDFMNDLISIARVGRSLGIHMILCTQKPAGVVDDQIWSNSDFKLCLRVQTKEDSNEMLKSPLAAEIREPGRGYLQVGRTSQFDLFQSGYSGQSESSDQQKDQAFKLYQLNLSAKKTLIFKHTPQVVSSDRTQCAAVLESIIEAFRASGFAYPEKLCQPPIPTVLTYEEPPLSKTYSIPVGIYDDPDSQAVHPLELEITGRNTLIAGSTQMGKTNLLMVLLRRIASSLTPSDVQVYIMDFNTMALKTMSQLSVIGGVVTADEEERLKNLLKLLKDEIASRKARFMDAGVTSFSAYREIHPDAHAILILIDNYAVFKELYEERYGDDITFLLREGPALGITFCVTVQQAAALNYRKLFFFNQRIVLPMGEQSEYSTVLEGCRVSPLETAGRVLISMNKQFYEGQTFEAFDGETEAQKAQAIRAFVQEHSGKPKARPIPSVPSLLTTAWIQETFAGQYPALQYPFGMDYASVMPAVIDLMKDFSLALVGGDQRGKRRFVDLFLAYAMDMASRNEAQIRILDGYERKLKAYQSAPGILNYSYDPDDIIGFFTETLEVLEKRLAEARQAEDAIPSGPALIYVVNSYEAIKKISDSSLLMDNFNTMAEKYRRMKIFFLFSDVDNKTINFSSPDLLRFIREERRALIFEEINQVKAFDISLMVQRSNSRPRSNNEAFLLSEEDVSRIKLIDSAE